MPKLNSPTGDTHSEWGHVSSSHSPAQQYYNDTLLPLSRELEEFRELEYILRWNDEVIKRIVRYLNSIQSISPLWITEDDRMKFARESRNETQINENIINRVLWSIAEKRKVQSNKKTLSILLEESLNEVWIDPVDFYIAFVKLKMIPQKLELDNARNNYETLAKAEANKSTVTIANAILAAVAWLLAINWPELIMFCQQTAQKIASLLPQ